MKIDNAVKERRMEVAAYDLTWALLNDLLGEFAYSFIDDMCKEDWDVPEADGD